MLSRTVKIYKTNLINPIILGYLSLSIIDSCSFVHFHVRAHGILAYILWSRRCFNGQPGFIENTEVSCMCAGF